MDVYPQIPEEMKRQYVQRRKADLEKLETALTAKDGDVFRRVGHQLKGNASTFGFIELEMIGSALESIGRSQEFDKAEEPLRCLRLWLESESSASLL